jgi:hypothetical protein
LASWDSEGLAAEEHILVEVVHIAFEVADSNLVGAAGLGSCQQALWASLGPQTLAGLAEDTSLSVLRGSTIQKGYIRHAPVIALILKSTPNFFFNVALPCGSGRRNSLKLGQPRKLFAKPYTSSPIVMSADALIQETRKLVDECRGHVEGPTFNADKAKALIAQLRVRGVEIDCEVLELIGRFVFYRCP